MSYQSYPSCLSSLIANGPNTAIIGELGISADIERRRRSSRRRNPCHRRRLSTGENHPRCPLLPPKAPLAAHRVFHFIGRRDSIITVKHEQTLPSVSRELVSLPTLFRIVGAGFLGFYSRPHEWRERVPMPVLPPLPTSSLNE